MVFRAFLGKIAVVAPTHVSLRSLLRVYGSGTLNGTTIRWRTPEVAISRPWSGRASVSKLAMEFQQNLTSCSSFFG
jgi:hypothetical protein